MMHVDPSVHSSTLSASSSSVQIGDGSYSQGDLYLECLLPKVIMHRERSRGGHRKLPHRPSQSPSSSSLDTEAEDDSVEVVPLAEHPAVLQAQAECQALLNGNEVTILEDGDVKEEVVQILGHEAQLVFPCRNIFRYVVLFIKNLEQFFEFQVEILDDKQEYRTFKATNARSLARIDASTCQLPLMLGQSEGWRYLCMDLQDLTARAFGSKHVTTTHLKIGSNCRLLRVYFQDERYFDRELPPHLTFLG
ncbi:TPA: hypothetical protein N0F65_001830 [Lagenidium giganteum]|uniref:CFA20 domain-containing protein n=1 Tax=Lagenidium giganteum TaxID=4803 RepID=A0AAV2Z9M6_9STRA|nr:TPA: hypothetical protein N0F65_001830 [Lagenidium giganteum]